MLYLTSLIPSSFFGVCLQPDPQFGKAMETSDGGKFKTGIGTNMEVDAHCKFGFNDREVAFCDNINAFSAPLANWESPYPFPESPPQPPVPLEVPVPEPLLTDQVRNDILYRRYLLLNLGGDPGDLGRMVNIISSQFFIEKTIEQALLQDG
ncbi:hypothetical protein Tco_0730709 [Tanacetum coccineum]